MLPVRFVDRSGRDLLDEFHRTVDRFWGGNGGPEAVSFGYSVDVSEDADTYRIEAELPGLTKQDINLTLEDGVLTIGGTKQAQAEKKDRGYHIRERRYGQFSRSFRLPSAVDENRVDATIDNGVLNVVLHKKEEVKPRKIEVQ